MDVRIGVTNTVKEIDVELPDDADRDKIRKQHRRRRWPTSPQVLWLTDKTRPRDRACQSAKIAYVELGGADGERRIGFGAGLTEPSPAAADERRRARACSTGELLFVTGKGGVGKTTIAAGLALLGGPAAASAPWSARSTPRATWPTSSRPARRASTPRELRPGPVRHVDGHRGVAARSTCSSS